ncbi:type II toxin-antitoxin system RelE/ParE family toxin [Thiolapillus sp.]
MADCKFTKKAEHDLEDIIDYTLHQWGVAQAHAYIDGLEERGQLLADNPGLGTRRESLSGELLSFPYESHILYYMQQPHGITIVRMLHQRMDPLEHME